ncbi:GntR family transcriptional regulator [Microvirga antarctica]|uniref:GntR family transcriptional regulator n=1 Tax=Microvirga antarctica TaxID=2819233 RepID=UPI001B311AB9|nr:GntR family transcriptional regulator [Microvirga antarctica]
MTDLRLEPVSSRTTIQDGVYNRLRHALMTGFFDPGQTLTIAALAEAFGTSHMPVREALRRLGAENALDVAPNGSTHVPPVNTARLDDLCIARIAVEGTAIALCTPHVEPETVRYLEANIRDHVLKGRDGDVFGMLANNQDFHFTLYRASGSDVLMQLIETLWLRFGPYMRLLTQRMEPLLKSGDLGSDPVHHRSILDAVKRDDGAAARQALVEDIHATQSLLRTICPLDDDFMAAGTANRFPSSTGVAR